MWMLREDGLAINTGRFDRIKIKEKGKKYHVRIVNDRTSLSELLFTGNTKEEALDYIKENFNDRR